MGERRKGPWLRKQDNCYYTTVGRELHKLGHASQPWQEIQDAYDAVHANRDNKSQTVRFAYLADQFLEWVKNRRGEGTYGWYLDYLTNFDKWLVANGHGSIRARNLNPSIVESWVDQRYAACSPSTKHGATRAIERVCNWAVKRGLLTRSPLIGIEKPTPETREIVIETRTFGLMLTNTDAEFRRFLNFMWETGCRVSEARIITAKHFDGLRFILEKRNSKGKKYNRVIYCNDHALAIVRPLIETHPSGPIFTNKKGEPWTKSRINSRFYRFRKKLKLDSLCATHIRHTWADRMVKQGMNPVVIATLMGHRNPSTFIENYQHVAQDAAYLQKSINAASAETPLLLPGPSAFPDSSQAVAG